MYLIFAGLESVATKPAASDFDNKRDVAVKALEVLVVLPLLLSPIAYLILLFRRRISQRVSTSLLVLLIAPPIVVVTVDLNDGGIRPWSDVYRALTGLLVILAPLLLILFWRRRRLKRRVDMKYSRHLLVRLGDGDGGCVDATVLQGKHAGERVSEMNAENLYEVFHELYQAGDNESWAIVSEIQHRSSGTDWDRRFTLTRKYLWVLLDENGTEPLKATIIAGAYAGYDVRNLDRKALFELGAQLQAEDPEADHIVSRIAGGTYERREEAQGRPRDDGDHVMTAKDARKILGVDEDADHDEIRRRMRELQQRTHSDKGGSDELFRIVREAGRILLEQ